MKKLLLIATPIMLSVVSVFSQDRPRYYDNFDSSRGVQVIYLPSPTTSYNQTTVASGKRLVKKTAMVMTMNVYDGFAQPEASPLVKPIGLVMAAGKYLKGYSTGNQLIDSYIVDSSGRYKIDPLLIYAQMNQESSFKVRATSNKGASGLMQLMPATARRMGVTNIYDPRQNIEGGVKYMRLLLDMFDGDVNLALAGYNAGEGAVIKYGYQIPPYNETQDYVRRISQRYRSVSYATTANQNKRER